MYAIRSYYERLRRFTLRGLNSRIQRRKCRDDRDRESMLKWVLIRFRMKKVSEVLNS